MNIDDIQVGKYYGKTGKGEKNHKLKCLSKRENQVTMQYDDDTVTSGLTMDFNRIECERYIYEIEQPESTEMNPKTQTTMTAEEQEEISKAFVKAPQCNQLLTELGKFEEKGRLLGKIKQHTGDFTPPMTEEEHKYIEDAHKLGNWGNVVNIFIDFMQSYRKEKSLQLSVDAKVFLSNHKHYQPAVGSEDYEKMLYVMVNFATSKTEALVKENQELKKQVGELKKANMEGYKCAANEPQNPNHNDSGRFPKE